MIGLISMLAMSFTEHQVQQLGSCRTGQITQPMSLPSQISKSTVSRFTR